MWTHFLSIVALSIHAGCPDPTAIATSPNLQRQIAVEGDIISAAMDSLYAASTKGRFVVQAVNMQIVEPIAMDFRSYLASASDAGGPILDDYIRRNSEACDLGPQFVGSATASSVSLVFDEDLAPLRTGTVEEFWRAFFVHFPGSGGLITVTRPGVDPSSGRAFLYIGRDCGAGCATGGYAWLRKRDLGWRLERYIIVTKS
jgi:hypothetical protein